MTQQFKKRLMIAAIITLVVAVFLTYNTYNTSKLEIDYDTIFEGKTEEQVKMELLELQNHKYEEVPVHTVETDDYRFDIFRVVPHNGSETYGFYIVGTNFSKYSVEGTEYITTGLVDFQLYETTDDNIYGELVEDGDDRLMLIEGTDIMVGYVEFLAGDANEYNLVIDSSNAEDKLDLEHISIYTFDATDMKTTEALEADANLKNGFSDDLEAAGYAKADIPKVLSTFVVSTLAVGGILVLSLYTLEKEVFNKKRRK